MHADHPGIEGVVLQTIENFGRTENNVLATERETVLFAYGEDEFAASKQEGTDCDIIGVIDLETCSRSWFLIS